MMPTLCPIAPHMIANALWKEAYVVPKWVLIDSETIFKSALDDPEVMFGILESDLNVATCLQFYFEIMQV